MDVYRVRVSSLIGIEIGIGIAQEENGCGNHFDFTDVSRVRVSSLIGIEIGIAVAPAARRKDVGCFCAALRTSVVELLVIRQSHVPAA